MPRRPPLGGRHDGSPARSSSSAKKMILEEGARLYRGAFCRLSDQRVVCVECTKTRCFEVVDDLIVKLSVVQRGLAKFIVGIVKELVSGCVVFIV